MVEEDEAVEGGTSSQSGDSEKKRFKVLEVFGIPLEVSNPRLADLLTMDAKEALREDVVVMKDKLVGTSQGTVTEERRRSDPDEAPSHAETFKSRADDAGEQLGFEVGSGGVWKSPTGVVILVRVIEENPTMEKAKRYAGALSEALGKLARDSAGLFVVHDQMTCDIFKAAIRSQNLYDSVRVIAADNVDKLLVWRREGRLAHRQVVTLLVPLENIDVGELLNVVGVATSIFES